MNPPVEPTAPRYVTCHCLHCKGGIEFDANQLRPNEKLAINCPHCKAETILAIPEKIAAHTAPATAPTVHKLEATAPPVKPPPKPAAVKPVIEQPPDTHEPARLVEWHVELPAGGSNGYIAYYEGARAVPFFAEFGGGVVLAVIHTGSPTDWNKLYPWAVDRRMKILKRVIQEVIRQRELFKCKADIDEKTGHIFFRDAEPAKPVVETAPPAKTPEPEPAKEPPKPEPPKPEPPELPKTPPVDDAKWQQEMGVAYFREKDFGAAVKCFSQAADLGEAEAQCYLGFCFMYGQGVDKNEAQAVEWFLKAAAQGHVGAEYCLGGAYYLGRGVAQDFSIAVKWWRKAGEHGNADAQYNLAGCFEKGEGVMRNFVEAYKWAKRAAAQGNHAAQKKSEELLGKMNPEQTALAKAFG